jgi:hypothetical protein
MDFDMGFSKCKFTIQNVTGRSYYPGTGYPHVDRDFQPDSDRSDRVGRAFQPDTGRSGPPDPIGVRLESLTYFRSDPGVRLESPTDFPTGVI